MGSAVATGAPVAAGRWVGPGPGRRGVARAVAVLLLGTGLVSSCATGGGRPEGAARGTSRPLLAPTGSSPTLAAPPAAPVGPVSPDGALPQTGESPSAASSTFRAQMAHLWQAVVSGDAAYALPAFFPLAAYRQVRLGPAGPRPAGTAGCVRAVSSPPGGQTSAARTPARRPAG